MQLIKTLLILTVSAGSWLTLYATTYYWDGATSVKASVAANWKIDDGAGGRTEATTAPVSGDSIVIDGQA